MTKIFLLVLILFNVVLELLGPSLLAWLIFLFWQSCRLSLFQVEICLQALIVLPAAACECYAMFSSIHFVDFQLLHFSV